MAIALPDQHNVIICQFDTTDYLCIYPSMFHASWMKFTGHFGIANAKAKLEQNAKSGVALDGWYCLVDRSMRTPDDSVSGTVIGWGFVFGNAVTWHDGGEFPNA